MTGSLSEMFVGRKQALDALHQEVDKSIRDHARSLVLILGAPGMGKTRLLTEFGKQRSDIKLIRGQCSQPPYRSFSDILFSFCDTDKDDDDAEFQSGLLAAVRSLLPSEQVVEVAHLLAYLAGRPFQHSPVIEPLHDQPEALQARTYLALVRFMTAVSKISPVVLVFDDLHQASRETVGLLQHLAIEISDERFIIVGTARRAVFHKHPELGGTGIPVTKIELNPMAAPEIDELLSSLHDSESGDLPKSIVECATKLDGSPRAVNGLFRLLVESEAILRTGSNLWRVNEEKLKEMTLPSSIDELVHQRLDLLPRADLQVIERAAVAGYEFEDDAVVALGRCDYLEELPEGPTIEMLTTAGDHTRVEVARALFRLSAADWITEIPTRLGPRQYTFTNPRITELIENRIPDKTRNLYHKFMAQWFQLSGGGRNANIQEIAGQHFGKSGDLAAAGACYRRAADFARRRFLNREALRLYSRALDCVPSWDLNVRIHIFHDLGSVQETIGDYHGALASFENMLRLSWVAASRVKAAVAFNKTGRIWRARRELDLALTFLERGKQLFEDEGDVRGIIGSLDDIGTVLHLLGRNQEASTMIKKSISLAGGDQQSPLAAARSHSILGNIQRVSGSPEGARQSHKRAFDLRLRAGDRLGVISSRCDIAQLSYEFGDLDAAGAEWNEALVGAENVGALPHAATASVGLGRIFLEKEDYNKATTFFDAAVQLAEDLDNFDLLVFSIGGLARTHVARGLTNGMMDLLGDLRELSDEAHLPSVRAQAMLALAATQTDNAAPMISQALDLLATGGPPFEMARALEELANVHLAKGENEAAKKAFQNAIPIYKKLGSKRGPAIETHMSKL